MSAPYLIELADRLRAAAADERLSTGALYLEAANVIDSLRRERVIFGEASPLPVAPSWTERLARWWRDHVSRY